MFEFETRKRSTLAYITLTIITVIGLAGCGGGSTTPELTAEDYLKMGWDSYTAGDYDEAEDYFDQTLELDPAMCETSTHSGVLNENCSSIEGWYTLNLSGGYNINSIASVQLFALNLTDQRYKPLGSGIQETGINIKASLFVKF